VSKISNDVHVYADQAYAVWTAPLGTALATTLPPAAPANFFEVGLLSDNGLTEAHNVNETKIYDLAGSLVRIARNQEERPWTFECLEENAVVLGLRYPGSTVTSSGATAEVQTITITGTPTGGTFNVTLPGYGTATGLVYNITTSALAAALSAAFSITVTVTGTPGTSYVVTFPAASGNISQMTVSPAFTGGTTPAASVATTTPGVTGVNSRHVQSGTGRNLRAWHIDLVDGTVHRRVGINNGEAIWTGTVGYTGSGAAISQFTLNPFKDSNGDYYVVTDDDPAMAGAFS
jgi:hypothetical protein